MLRSLDACKRKGLDSPDANQNPVPYGRVLWGVLLLLALLAVPDPAGVFAGSKRVSADAIVYQGHSYKRYESGLTWTAAKKKCERLGGHLVTITSQGEQDFVYSLIREGNKNAYWLGGRTGSGTGKWITGEAFTYSNWAYGQPDAYRNAESYMQIYNAYNPHASNEIGEWNDITINNVIPGEEDFFRTKYSGFICEWDS